MAKVFNNKINLLKALAIIAVVSGHLEFSIIPMFPPYSFQIILFFFIAGMLFNEKYSFLDYCKHRIKGLLIPYFLYEIVYLGITFLITPVVGKFWGMPVNLKNELLIPFITGHQLDLISPMWFVPALFISLIVYYLINKLFNKLNVGSVLRFVIFLIMALVAIQMEPLIEKSVYFLPVLRVMFSLLFIFSGDFYEHKLQNKERLFNLKILSGVLVLQALLWLTNADYTPIDGIGLSFILAWGDFDNWIVPILTGFTGIWISLLIINVSYEYIKNWDFLQKVGQNTYHIMANHLLVFNFITYSALYLKNIPFEVKNNVDIYWFYCPLKSTYFYFVVGMIVTTYAGEALKFIKQKAVAKITAND